MMGAGTMEAKEVIRLEHIGKSYYIGKQEVPVLTDINLVITKGDFVSIMGPSGAGKSTLMNILGCLDRPTRGSYILNGKEVANPTDDELANVILPMIYGNVFRNERVERATKMLEMVGLGNRINHMPAEMSGGQRQRVAIARALVNDPSIIMADEPTGNLDSKSTREVMEIFSHLYSMGKTIILVTHEDDVASYASRHVILSDGHISQDFRGALS